jgi:hypothetical protein
MSFTREQIEAELKSRGVNVGAPNMPSAPMSDGGLLRNGDTSNSFGFMSHPIANTMKGVRAVQDFAGGLAGGAQRFGSFIGEAAEYPTHAAYEKITGNKVPHFNVREMMGLEGENPVDLRKMISHDPNSLMSSLGGLSPAIAAGGASIPKQIVANGLWGAIQADPGQENLGGILPSGRVAAGAEDAALTGVGGALLKYGPGLIKAGAKKVGEAWNYINPNKDAASFLKTLGSGTKEENAQALAKEIQEAHQKNLDEALSHKTPIYEKEAKTDIYKTPESALPEGNLDKVAYYIAPGQKVNADQLEQLGKEIKNYRTGMPDKEGKPQYDFEDFTHNVQAIFKSDMNQTQIDNLEHALSVPTEAESGFKKMAEKNSKLIEGNTREVYDKFMKKPTLKNADELQKQLGDDYGYYENLNKEGKLEPALKPRLKQLSDLRNALKDEMQAGLNRKNPAYGEEIDKFNKKYRENVVPYGQEDFTKNIVNEGKKVRAERAENPSLPFNVTSGEAASYFANPTREALKVSGDIGEAGRNKILYNLLADETKPEAKGLAQAILQAKQSKGYSRYISPEMTDLAEQLLKRTKWRKRAGVGAGLVGAGALTDAGYELMKKLL